VRVPSAEFWRGKTVLLTGHTGFKGSWACVMLLELGARVVGFSLPGGVSEPDLFDAAGLGGRVEDNRGNVNDGPALAALVQSVKPDIVLHMAAQPLVRLGLAEPIETLETNIMGVAKVLMACRDQPNIKAVAIVTSDKCYENRERVWSYREDEAMGGKDPYSASKGCAELVASAFARSYFSASGPRVISVRAGNVIGGGDWAADRLLPDLVRAYQSKNTLEIRSPSAVRPWQHVLEPVSGYLIAIEHATQKETWSGFDSWNFGPTPGDELTVGEVVKVFQDEMGGEPKVHFGDEANTPKERKEAGILRVDPTKAKVELNWSPKWDNTYAVKATARWYTCALKGDSVGTLVRNEVLDFLK
jgi:CDP-glucose 4,6-dehydratase